MHPGLKIKGTTTLFYSLFSLMVEYIVFRVIKIKYSSIKNGELKMKKLISIRLASNIIITINTIALLVHVLILLKIVPHDFVWGGRLKSEVHLIIFESISIVMQTLFISIIAVKAGYVFKGKFNRTVKVGLWVLFGLMVLNTLGNLVSRSGLETMVMTPITCLLALLVFRLVIEK